MKPVEFHPAATAELDAAVGYYEQRVPGLGLDLRKEVEAATQKIQAARLLMVNAVPVTGMAESNLQTKLVWITGADGLIGNYLVQTALQFTPRWRVRALTREQFDLLDFATVRHEFQKDSPQLIIHCAAISAPAEAQKNPALARRVNVEVTKLLAELAAEIQFVFFSTDLVFDGRKGNYIETDAPNPLHIYGETKVAAEEIVLKNPRHLVVRTSLNCGISRSGSRGFNEQFRHSLQAGQGMTLFTDEFRSPIPAVETARAVWELAGKNCAGIYHIAGAERLSRWQIGQLLVKRWSELKTEIKSGSARDFSGPPRALDTSLDISKVQKVLSRPLPGLGDWLAANPAEKF
jgi:dTDP-4-dehydrorhamnose reductase